MSPPCLTNPMDRGAWWAAVHRVTQSQTRLKQLSSSSSRLLLCPGPPCMLGQGSLACCSLWGCRESDTTERLNNDDSELRILLRGTYLQPCRSWEYVRAFQSPLWMSHPQPLHSCHHGGAQMSYLESAHSWVCPRPNTVRTSESGRQCYVP